MKGSNKQDEFPEAAPPYAAPGKLRGGPEEMSWQRPSSYPSSPYGHGNLSREGPRINAADGDLARKSDAAWAALQASNEPPWLFRFGNQLCRIETDDQQSPTSVPMTQERLRGHLARVASWFKKTKNGDEVPAHPPPAVVKDILAMPFADADIVEADLLDLTPANVKVRLMRARIQLRNSLAHLKQPERARS